MAPPAGTGTSAVRCPVSVAKRRFLPVRYPKGVWIDRVYRQRMSRRRGRASELHALEAQAKERLLVNLEAKAVAAKAVATVAAKPSSSKAAAAKPVSVWAGGDGERSSLWDGAAPLGSGRSERGDAFLTVYRPNGTTHSNRTAVIICPGGSFRTMSFGWAVGAEGAAIARWFASVGIVGILLTYRLPHGRPALPLLDALQAVTTVRRNARRGLWPDVHPRRIGIMGFSAGGNVAALAATRFTSGADRADFGMLIYPVVSMRVPYTHLLSRRELMGSHPSDETIELYSAERHVSHRTPPTFLSHALDDPLVDPANSLLYYNACQAHRVRCDLFPLATGGHPFVVKPQAWEPCRSAALAWLRALVLPHAETNAV